MNSGMDQQSLERYEIRPASAQEVAPLPAIEVMASAIFPVEDIALEMREHGLSQSFFEDAAAAGRVWIAYYTPESNAVGFALVILVDDSAHLYEMDVHPDHARRGIGGALVETVAAWARGEAFASLTLTTFRHLAWNAPFYRRHGFVELDAAELGPAPELARLLKREAENGLDPANRVAMLRDLTRSSALPTAGLGT